VDFFGPLCIVEFVDVLRASPPCIYNVSMLPPNCNFFSLCLSFTRFPLSLQPLVLRLRALDRHQLLVVVDLLQRPVQRLVVLVHHLLLLQSFYWAQLLHKTSTCLRSIVLFRQETQPHYIVNQLPNISSHQMQKLRDHVPMNSRIRNLGAEPEVYNHQLARLLLNK